MSGSLALGASDGIGEHLLLVGEVVSECIPMDHNARTPGNTPPHAHHEATPGLAEHLGYRVSGQSD